jgi:hypothetical protein
MKIALIPPIPNLETYRQRTDLHMVLSHLLDDPFYLEFYKKVGMSGEWITLDNSAHEMTGGQPMQELLPQAIAIRAREIVMPDYLFHAMFTVEATRDAFQTLTTSPLFSACSPTPKLMIVPQGADEDDWAWCLDQQLATAKAHGLDGLVTLGLSKDYVKFPGGLRHLIREYLLPKQKPIHLLGWTCTWDLIDLARDFPSIRSTDTAKPFLYAYRNIPLNHYTEPRKLKRPDYYFSLNLEDHYVLAEHNLAMFKLAARGVTQVRPEEALR